MKSPFVRVEEKNDLRIVYFRADGSSAIFIGGTRTWRNCNPGNIAYGNGKRVRKFGAIGKAGGFAVFSDSETGEKAIYGILKEPDFQERTLSKAIEVWAPAADKNDPESYKRDIRNWTGLDLNRKIRSLSKREVVRFVRAIRKREGWRPGKVLEIPTPNSKRKITSVRKNKKGTIVRYYVEEFGWLKKDEAIALASKGKIDAVVATSRSGNLYLRTRPDPAEENLDDMG